MTTPHAASGLKWLNEPPRWQDTDGELRMLSGEKTDFWRETHYGFIRDNGHLYHREAGGDFSATVEFRGKYEALYDQAGMMLRLDERNWIKAGIEYVGGRKMLSVVVTRDFSDWSTMPMPLEADWVRLRCSRNASAVRIEWGTERTPFTLLRLAYLPAGDPILVGPMCCSPQLAGLEVQFRGFDIGPLTSDAPYET